MPKRSYWIGYPALEAWAANVEADKPVLALLITEPGPRNKNGLSVDKSAVIVQQIRADACVHYCRLVAARHTMIAGRPFETDDERRREMARQLYALVTAWLKEHQLTVREAVVTAPTGLVWLEGWADFIGYDKNTQTYFRREAGEPA